ncbi:MAG: hypothetical protein Q4E61_02670 [Alphaproteobacteria bacterium]|nr:hypothetical protein [Alphaproteobacteria bacterium]
MNKNLKLAIGLIAILAVGGCGYIFYDMQKSENTEQLDQDNNTNSEASEKVVETSDKIIEEQKTQLAKSEENIKPVKSAEVKKSEDAKASDENKEKINAVSSDKLNSSPVDSKKTGKTMILFRDGTRITDTDIKDELDNIPEQISGKMSLTEIKSFLAWKKAYDKVMTEVANKSGLRDSEKIKELIAKRKITAAGFMLLDEEAKKLMTFDALKKHYDKVWDKNFKGTKEFSLVAITTADKNIPDQIKKNVKDLSSLKKFLETNSANVKSMDMDSRPQAMFPPEISDVVLKQGANTIVGPFEVKGTFMMFFIKSINDAQKKEFTEEFAEEYKKVASKDFIKEYTESLYKKYKVQIFDVNKKVVDPFNIIGTGNKKESDEKALVALTKLKDDAILAKMTKGIVTVKDLKDFFKVDSLLNETFISMAKQFNISPEDVIVYAVKLVMDDKVLACEVAERKYTSLPAIEVKLKEVENMELKHAYFKENVKVKSEDVKRTFDKFIKSIPEEDKNDNEISVKLAFFTTQDEAEKSLNAIQSGEEKFSNIYKEKVAKKESIDLGYVKKRGVSPELWSMLKTGASGACCKQIVQLNSEQFGVSGKNFALVYIADRRPVTLPSLSNEAERKYFHRLAEREKAVDLVKVHLIASIKSIEGKPIEEINKTASDQIDRIISVLLGYAG